MPSASYETALVEVHHLGTGHSDSVTSLSFSPDGTHLASGGDDRTLIIWNAVEGRLVYRLMFESPIDCVLWHPQRAGTVVVGCESGYLFQIWDLTQRSTQRYEIQLGILDTIHCLDYDKKTCSLAVGVGTDVYVIGETRQNVYEGTVMYSPPPGLENAGQEREDRMNPVGIHFSHDGEYLIASYLAHGIRCWNARTRDVIWHIVPPTGYPNIGSSALSPDQSWLATYNLVNGVHLYPLPTPSKQPKTSRLFKLVTLPRTSHTVHLGFPNAGRSVACGTTTGGVHVWNLTNGDTFQVLSHGNDIVQAIATTDRAGYTYIATGSIDKGQSTYIKIWRAKIARIETTEHTAMKARFYDFFKMMSTMLRPLSPASILANRWVIDTLISVACALFVAWAWTFVPWQDMWEFLITMWGLVVTWVPQGVDRVSQAVDSMVRWLRDIPERVRISVVAWLQIEELLNRRDAAGDPGHV